MNLEDMLEGPAGPGIIRRAFDILRRVQKLQSNDTKTKTHDSAPTSTLPKNSEALKAAIYAEEVNQAGARMRRKDCRPSLRRGAQDAEPEIIGPSKQQRLDAFVASENYAKECRSRWRKG